MWSTGKFVNNAPAFSRQNYDDITEEYALSRAERAKYGKDARKKSVKTKRVSVYLATLKSWGQDKWNTLLTDVKTAIESSTSRKKRNWRRRGKGMPAGWTLPLENPSARRSGHPG